MNYSAPFVFSILLVGVSTIGCKQEPSSSSGANPSEQKQVGSGPQRANVDYINQTQKLQRNVLQSGGTQSSKDELTRALQALDPDQLAELISSLDPDGEKEDRALLFSAFIILAQTDPARALDVGCTLPMTSSSVVAAPVHKSLVETDPSAVAKWIAEAELSQLNTKAGTRLAIRCAQELARNAPDEALALINKCSGKRQSIIAANVLGALARDDPGRAFDAANNLSDESSRLKSLKAVLGGTSATDPAQAFQMTAKLDHPDWAQNYYGSMFNRWFEKDAAAATETLKTLEPVVLQRTFQDSKNVASLIDTDPGGTTEILDKLPFTKSNVPIFSEAAKKLAKANPTLTMDWLRSFPPSSNTSALIKEATQSWAETNPETLAPKILLEQRESRKEVIAGAGYAWGRSNATEALSFQQHLPSSEQPHYVASVLTGSLKYDPETTAEIISGLKVSDQIRSSQEYSQVVRETAVQFANEDLSKAADWVNNLTGSAQAEASSGLVSIWAKSDVSRAAEWIQQLPSGPVRNAAVLSMIQEIEATDPQTAAEWRSTLSD